MGEISGAPLRTGPLRTQDIPDILEIERATFGTPWSASAFQFELANTHGGYLGLWLTPPLTDDVPPTLLGYAGGWLVVDQAHVANLAIATTWRGLGLGQVLFHAFMVTMRQHGAQFATLEVRVSNHAAQCLYAKYGFEAVGRRKRYYTDNREDAHIMTTGRMDTADYGELLAAHWCDLQQHLMQLDWPRLTREKIAPQAGDS